MSPLRVLQYKPKPRSQTYKYVCLLQYGVVRLGISLTMDLLLLSPQPLLDKVMSHNQGHIGVSAHHMMSLNYNFEWNFKNFYAMAIGDV